MSGAPDREKRATAQALSLLEEGLSRYREGDSTEAHALFGRAHRSAPSDARIMSWYGLTLVLVEKNSNLGILYCDQALRLAGPEPELFLNLVRAHLALGQREHAVKVIRRGMAANPTDPGLKLALSSMGYRGRPILPFFSRSNFVNRWLGRLRHRLSRRIHPVARWTPMTIGLLPDDEKK
ncbi:MAG TPA: tetratricopeptide repeat protein [Anaeromyxobacteraceae bacterium]|nr:tetratricopeptide repeat protein [Anaeromyxobacteraceae bacterium]